VVGEFGAGLILMHSRGTVETMASYDLASYPMGVVAAVHAELSESLARARAAGVRDECIVLDPGLGFAKRADDSVTLLARIDEIVALGYPVLIGPSRKRFVGEAAGGLAVEDRLEGTIAACVAARLSGVSLFRVHDVRAVARALALADALVDARA
jgi:dihydropteroate synthase